MVYKSKLPQNKILNHWIKVGTWGPGPPLIRLSEGMTPMRKFAPRCRGGGGGSLTGVQIIPKIAKFLENLKKMPPQF